MQPTEQTPKIETKPENEPSQEEMERLYREQQQRLSCPGCGESPFLG